MRLRTRTSVCGLVGFSPQLPPHQLSKSRAILQVQLTFHFQVVGLRYIQKVVSFRYFKCVSFAILVDECNVQSVTEVSLHSFFRGVHAPTLLQVSGDRGGRGYLVALSRSASVLARVREYVVGSGSS